MERGLCRGMDTNVFFPQNGHNLLTRPAKETCNRCPVQLECLEYALDKNIDHGTWGGVSENERRRIRRARKSRLRLAQTPSVLPESAHG